MLIALQDIVIAARETMHTFNLVPDTPHAITMRDCTFGYPSRVVLQVEHFQLNPSECLGLVGASGSGKTTLLSAIAGASEPLSGQMTFFGESWTVRRRIENISKTFQSFPLFHWLTVRENLELTCRIRQVPRRVVDDLLIQLSALHLAGFYPKRLSGGERCRASLAQALVGKPKLLLLDEPFTGLDFLVKEDVARSILTYASLNKVAVIIATHDILDAARLCDRVVVFGGKHLTKIVAEVKGRQQSSASQIEAHLRTAYEQSSI